MINKYICDNCKENLYGYELKRVEGEWIDCRYYGEHIGWQYEGDDYVCPYCGSYDLIKANVCPLCGEFHDKEESYGGYCEKCAEKAATPENLIEWCDNSDYKESMEINCEVLYMCKYLKIDIEAVLKSAIFESVYKDKLNAYCKKTVKEDYDTEFFMKWWKDRG